MKKIIILIALFAISFSSFAQDKKQQTLSEIRGQYANCLQVIKDRSDEPNVIDYANFTISENWPGSGRHEKTIEVFYSMNFDEEGDMSLLSADIKFIRTKYNWGAVDYLEEYLFDSNKLVFVFSKEYSDSMSNETRIYNKNGIIILDQKTKEGNNLDHKVNMQVVKADKEILEIIGKGQNYQNRISNFLKNN